jgi:hypothetical protein
VNIANSIKTVNLKKLLLILLFVSQCYSQPNIIYYTGWERYLPGEQFYGAPNAGGKGTNIYGTNYTQYGEYIIKPLTPYTGNGALSCVSWTQTSQGCYTNINQVIDGDFKYFITPSYLWGTIYANVRINFHYNNSQSARIFHFANDFPFSQEFALQWTTNNHFALMINGSVKATSGATLPLDTWLLCQMSTTWGNSGVTSTISLNGETLTDHTNIGTDSITGFMMGFIDHIGGNFGTACYVSFDDLVISTGAAADTNARCLLSKPVSDQSTSNWKRYNDSTTSLYLELNKALPDGVPIKNNNSSANNSYVCNMQDYVTAGLPGGMGIYATQALVRHGRADTAGVDTGRISISSNPTDASTKSLFFATFPGNTTKKASSVDPYGYLCGECSQPACLDPYWFTALGTITLSPSVNTSAQPQITVTRLNNAGTTHVDYVDDIRISFLYTPAAPGTTKVNQDDD